MFESKKTDIVCSLQHHLETHLYFSKVLNVCFSNYQNLQVLTDSKLAK